MRVHVILLLLLVGCGGGDDRHLGEHAQGLKAIERSEYAEAEAHFRKALARRDTPATRLDLARVLLVRGDLEAAEVEFKNFIARDERPRAYLQVFTAYYLMRHPEPARRWLKQALGRYPEQARLHAALGELETSLGNHQAALSAFNKGLALAPRKTRDRYHVSIARTHLLATVASLSAERERLGGERDWHQLHQRLAKLAREGKVAILPAVLSLKRALYINPDNLQAHLLLGSVYHQLGRLEEAQLEMEQAVRISPRLPSAHYVLGTLRHARGQVALAIVAYREALTLAPKLDEARISLAIALLENGAGPEALSVLARLGDRQRDQRLLQLFADRLVGNANAVDALVHALERSTDKAARSFAASLLARITGETFGEDAAQWRKWQRDQQTSKK